MRLSLRKSYKSDQSNEARPPVHQSTVPPATGDAEVRYVWTRGLPLVVARVPGASLDALEGGGVVGRTIPLIVVVARGLCALLKHSQSAQLTLAIAVAPGHGSQVDKVMSTWSISDDECPPLPAPVKGDSRSRVPPPPHLWLLFLLICCLGAEEGGRGREAKSVRGSGVGRTLLGLKAGVDQGNHGMLYRGLEI